MTSVLVLVIKKVVGWLILISLVSVLSLIQTVDDLFTLLDLFIMATTHWFDTQE